MTNEDPARGGLGRRASDADRLRMIVDIEKLDLRIGGMDDQITNLRIEVGKLGVKAGMWGAVAGAITAIVPLVGILFALAKTVKP